MLGSNATRYLSIRSKRVTWRDADFGGAATRGELVSKAGQVYKNPVTGERVVIRLGTEESDGEHLVADLYVAPGGAVAGEHVHRYLEETFTVLRGNVGFRLDGREDIARPNRKLVVSPGVIHDWWNAGEEEAHVVVELHGQVDRLRRFEIMISTLYGLARYGKTDAREDRTFSRPHYWHASSQTSSSSPHHPVSCNDCSLAASRPWRVSWAIVPPIRTTALPAPSK
jgi:quercetin dioxygenase-like cupin family protein